MTGSGEARPGGRTARTREAVHRATRELLADPTAEVSMAGVAARSGVHPTTLYRRWRTVESIVLEVAIADVTDRLPVAATGDLRGDLTDYVHRLLTSLQRSGTSSVLKAMLAAAAQARERADVAVFVEPRIRQFQAMLDAAGVTEINGTRLVELILAPAYLWVQLNAPLDPDLDTDRLVDTVLGVVRWKRGDRGGPRVSTVLRTVEADQGRP